MEPTTIEGIRAVDSLTFQIRLEEPDLAFLPCFAYTSRAILPRDEVQRLGSEFWTHPVGTGPFLLEKWRRGTVIRLKRNPFYFRPKLPRLDAVEFMVGVDPTTQLMMFERGELDLQIWIPEPAFARLQKDPRLRPSIRTVPQFIPLYIALNCDVSPFTNRLVRQAMNYAVNKRVLVKKLLGRAVPARGILPKNLVAFNPDLPEYAYDPARARSLLTEAGWGNGFESTLWVGAYSQLAESVQEDLRAVGIRVHIRTVSFSAMLQACDQPAAVPMAMLDWGGTIDDPKETLDSLLNSANLTPEGCGGNRAHYRSSEVDQLLQAAAPELDAARRLRLYRQIEEVAVRDAPFIFLCQSTIDSLQQPWLQGVAMGSVGGSARLEQAWLDK